MFEIKWIIYGLSRMLQFSEFVWALSYSVWDVFNNFLLIDATNRSKISSDQKRFFISLSLLFLRTLPLMNSTAYNLWTFTWFVHFVQAELDWKIHTEGLSKFHFNIYSILFCWTSGIKKSPKYAHILKNPEFFSEKTFLETSYLKGDSLFF